MERTSAARNRRNATARRNAATNASVAVGGAQGQQDLQLRAQAGVADRGGPDQERFGVRAEGAELFLDAGFRARPAVGCRSGPS